MDDFEFMRLAISMAAQFDPPDRARIPRVGAVIAKDNAVIAVGHRGPDKHAEKTALDAIADRSLLREATVYTTLEPCTGAVRSRPHEACTNLLTEAQVKKVFIGILDPNQGVCGKGILELQKHGIEVALFEHELAQEIRDMNLDFIRAQQSLGIEIISPRNGEALTTSRNGGKHTFKCTCNSDPGQDVVVIVRHGGLWWPQTSALNKVSQSADEYEYEFDVTFGSTGHHEIHIVKASDLGLVLKNYYQHVISRNRERSKLLKTLPTFVTDIEPIIKEIGDYPGIAMTKLPRGLDSQCIVTVEIN